MDKLRVLDLFSGIGGFSLGLERAGMETVAFCEIEEYPRKVLAKHWPNVPCYSDVRELNATRLAADGFTGIDLICGGFPCQPFSTAARGKNNAIDLWPEMERIINEVGPKYVIAENVIERPIRTAEARMEQSGYGTWVKRIGADDAGGDHQRSRWWLCAYPYKNSKFHRAIDAKVEMLPQLCEGIWGPENYSRALRVSHGLPNRLDRVKALGNAVVPQIPEIIGRAIIQSLNDG